jgi:hypothetical protein
MVELVGLQRNINVKRETGQGLERYILNLAGGGAGYSDNRPDTHRVASRRGPARSLRGVLHCPSDTVVWVDVQNGTYHLKGRASYAHAREAATLAAVKRNGLECER